MGATSSSQKDSPKIRQKHQNRDRRSHPPHIAAKESRQTVANDSYNQGSNIHIGPVVRTDTVHSGEYDNNTNHGARVTIHTDIPSQVPPQPTTPRQNKHQPPPPAKGNIHLSCDSDEEDVPRAPVIIRSSPECHRNQQREHPSKHHHGKELHSHHGKEPNHHGKEPNHHQDKAQKPDTIKQAKVNVKDRISKFSELPVPKENRPRTAISHEKLHDRSPNLLSVPEKYDGSMRRGSEASALERLRASKKNQPEFTQRMEKEKISNTPKQASRKRSELRRGSEPAVLADHHLHIPYTIPAPDYDDISVPDAPRVKGDKEKPQLHRINTLEYFDQLISGYTPLKAFEKAKPVRNIHKSNSPLPKRAYTPREQKQDNEPRPKSMFLPSTNYSSDLNVASAHNHLHLSNEDLVSANQSDDDLDNLAKKKMAGQRLPVGEIDPKIESKFLLSLKRNIEMREARHRGNGRPTSKSLENLVF